MEPEEMVLVITGSMNQGFDKLHSRIDGIGKEFTNHQVVCANRFVYLETDKQLRLQADIIREKRNKEGRDWWKWTIRLVVVFAIPSIPWAVYKLTKLIEALKKMGIVE